MQAKNNNNTPFKKVSLNTAHKDNQASDQVQKNLFYKNYTEYLFLILKERVKPTLYVRVKCLSSTEMKMMQILLLSCQCSPSSYCSKNNDIELALIGCTIFGKNVIARLLPSIATMI